MPRLVLLSASLAIGLAWAPDPALANGWIESRPWQFDTSADKANKAGVLDMIERKKGGYYDGFKTTITNTTNIGTQVNCNNTAEAMGNAADNGQTANSPNVANDSDTSSSATGNTATNGTDGDADVDNGQTNTGPVSSGVSGTTTGSSSGAITTGASDQVLNNDQTNSGAQTASLNDSTACGFNGPVTGTAKSRSSGPLN